MDNLYTLDDIFTKRIFRIPDYQRGYAWRAHEQIKDFWDDLNNLQPNRNHYTGLLSIAELTEEETAGWYDEQWLMKSLKYKPYHVVDGQQRLTTAIILIQAIYDFIKSIHPEEDEEEVYLEEMSLEDIKEKYISKQKKNDTVISYIFGYESDNPSYNFLKSHIFHERIAATHYETYYTLNLENAYTFFMENLDLLHKAEGEEGVVSLFQKLTQYSVFNIFEIKSEKKDFDVYAAFETMNNRGKKLSTLELLKNRLIYLTTLYSDEELDIYSKKSLREKINDSWKVVYEQLGKKKTSPLDDDEFLQAHWILTFPYTRTNGINFAKDLLEDRFSIAKVQKKKSYDTGVKDPDIITDSDFEEETVPEAPSKAPKLTPKAIEKYVLSLSDASVKWFYTWFPFDAGTELTDDEKQWLDNLNRINIAYFRPLVTASLIAELQPESRVRLFKAIERFIFIAFRCQTFLSTYKNSEYYRYALMLNESKAPEDTVNDIINSLNNNLAYDFTTDAEDSSKQYFKSELLKNVIGRKNGLYYEWGVRHYFLYEYEKELASQAFNRRQILNWDNYVKAAKGKLTIEHILPQTPDNEYWKEQFKDVSEERMRLLEGSLGNLMILSLSINASLQNDSFPDKKAVKYGNKGEIVRQGYCNGSYSEQEVAKYENWTEDTIKERGMKMLAFMEKRWNMTIRNDEERMELLFLDNEEFEDLTDAL